MPRIVLLTLAALSVLAPGAGAQQTNAPPGNSGVDQYLESVPSSSGNTSSSGVAGSKGAGKPSAAVSKTLQGRGSDGAQLARLVAARNGSRVASDKQSAAGRTNSSSSSSSSPRQTQAGAGGSGAVRAAAAAATGSGGGMGPWLGILLGAVALAAILVLAARLARKRG